MSYNVAIVAPPLPDDDQDAWTQVNALIDAQGSVPAVFEELLAHLTARYPCICDLDDDNVDDGVWSDGPLRNNLGHRASVLGMVYSRVEEVLPFLIREAKVASLDQPDSIPNPVVPSSWLRRAVASFVRPRPVPRCPLGFGNTDIHVERKGATLCPKHNLDFVLLPG